MRKALTMLAVGDLILGGPEPDLSFALAAPVLTTADVLIGQGEAPFTSRSIEKYYLEVPTEIFATPSCDPANMKALAFSCHYSCRKPHLGFGDARYRIHHQWSSRSWHCLC